MSAITSQVSSAIARASGNYIALVDLDLNPVGPAFELAIAHMEAHPDCAALRPHIVAPTRFEIPSIPTIAALPGTLFRRSAIEHVGGIFRMQDWDCAGFDLSARLLRADFSIASLQSYALIREHLHASDWPQLPIQVSIRESLANFNDHLCEPYRSIYRQDFLWRLSRQAAQRPEIRGARYRAWMWEQVRRLAESWTPTTNTPSKPSFADTQKLLSFGDIEQQVATWATSEMVQSVVLIDVGPHIYTIYHACRQLNLRVLGILTPNACYQKQEYRGIPVLATAGQLSELPDGAILSHFDPQAQQRARAYANSQLSLPILRFVDEQGALMSVMKDTSTSAELHRAA